MLALRPEPPWLRHALVVYLAASAALVVVVLVWLRTPAGRLRDDERAALASAAPGAFQRVVMRRVLAAVPLAAVVYGVAYWVAVR